jgi:hypothetical protein
MKKTIFSLFSLLVFTALHAQINYKVNENTYQKVSISFTFENLKSIDIATVEGNFSRIYIDGCGKSADVGTPELPVSVNMLEIPVCGDFVVNTYGKDFVIYDAEALEINYPIYPVQPSVSKSQENPVDFFYHKETYQTNDFYALPLAKFEEVGVMRNLNIGELCVSPVQYNPVTNQFKIYRTIDVEILFKKTEFVKTQVIKDLHRTPLFYPVNVINPVQNSKAEFENTPVKYLIVAHEQFRGGLNQFIAWKKRKGFLVEVAYTDEDNVGITTTSIADFIKSHYDNATEDNPAPTFVLLVGDVEQIPTFTYNHPTDLYYFTWAGGNLPCCYYGRFSARNLDQLTPQIEKTLQYEQFTMPDANYLNNAVLVAGYDITHASTYGNGQLNYMVNNYVNAAQGFSKIYKHPHPCNKEAEIIRAEIGAGAGLVNYTAHGSANGWSNPLFNTYSITQMNNENKYGLLIGNCCESNKFDVNECFGEALLRTPKKGAVGYIGGSDDTYWDEDYYWAIGFRTTITQNPQYNPDNLGALDRLFHTHNEAYTQWMGTFGAMITAGNWAVQTSNSNLKQYYWEIYHLMGDPSIMTYLAKPARMTVEINDVIPFDDSTLYAKVAPYSYCALTNEEKELVCAGFADEKGNITLKFKPVTEHHRYEFAAWAQKYIQYFKTVYSGYVGIEENDPTGCALYPNPTTGELQVTSYKLQVTSIEVFDMYGRQLSSNPLIPSSSNPLINISHLPAGIYFVKVTTEKGNTIKKIIKL